jgi:hypothetical protein
MSQPVHVRQSFVGEAPNWLEGHVVTATLRGLPCLVPLRRLPAVLGGTVTHDRAACTMTGKCIGWAFPRYLDAKSDGVEVRVEIENSFAGQCLIDMLRLYGPGPGTVSAVVSPENELLAVAVTPGGYRVMADSVGH